MSFVLAMMGLSLIIPVREQLYPGTSAPPVGNAPTYFIYGF